MNYKDLNIKISYHSQGSDSIVEAFINPALKCTKIYKRSVGFFSSSVLSSVLDGLQSLVDNGGSIQLIASPRLSQEDIDAINLGLKEKDQVVNNSFSEEFEAELQKISDDELILLAKLVALKILEIQIAVTDAKYGDGMYHDKFGILEDFDGNKVVFYGSPNSSEHGYKANFEKIRVVKSWIPGQNISSEYSKYAELILSKLEGQDDSQRVMQYSNIALNILEEYTTRLQSEKTRILALTITQCYRKLANKQNLIEKIVMDPKSLDIIYLNNEDKEVPKESLSAGEKQLMVIAILWALAICSKKKLPVIIDTPLSRLDSEHRSALVTTYFPNASEQTIILSTDSEIDSTYYEMMKDSVGDEFTLNYDDESRSTSIARGYFAGECK